MARQPLPSMEVIYFVRPTREKLNFACAEFGKGDGAGKPKGAAAQPL